MRDLQKYNDDELPALIRRVERRMAETDDIFTLHRLDARLSALKLEKENRDLAREVEKQRLERVAQADIQAEKNYRRFVAVLPNRSDLDSLERLYTNRLRNTTVNESMNLRRLAAVKEEKKRRVETQKSVNDVLDLIIQRTMAERPAIEDAVEKEIQPPYTVEDVVSSWNEQFTRYSQFRAGRRPEGEPWHSALNHALPVSIDIAGPIDPALYEIMTGKPLPAHLEDVKFAWKRSTSEKMFSKDTIVYKHNRWIPYAALMLGGIVGSVVGSTITWVLS